MAITNYERVGKALELLRDGLKPFVERELEAKHGEHWQTKVKEALSDRRLGKGKKADLGDVAVLLVVMDKTWGHVFGAILGRAERNLVNELTDVRNKWAHQEPFSGDDADRALDSAERLATAVSAPQADEIRKIKMELRRTQFDEQARNEKRKAAGTAIASETAMSLTPWREVVTPHDDVAGGRYQQAEFAADLWQVYLGEGTDEYRDPEEFFRRTFLTESLHKLLVGAVERLTGKGADPVVQLQTNFGGGKTHSMLALYHLFSGIAPSDLAGVEAVLKDTNCANLPAVRRAVLVGNKISPGNPVKKSDGTVVRTLWGELAWQLGHSAGGAKEAKKAFERVKADDEHATNPGDALRQLFAEYGPCLILIDEWVAYARQLHDQSDLPAGGFETQFTFAQALTEAARAANDCLLVISLPASDTTGSPHAQADDVEVGGQRGREALDRLRNVVGRIESSWRPASAEEGFEIVRRRLFEPMADPKLYRKRDAVARAFAEFYRAHEHEFPPESREFDYEKRIKDAYPIHPEIFDRLYTDWSTLIKFQRTRGVLRLMAAVIHSLWEKGDRNPLILPANIPIDDNRVQSELTRYLSDNWAPVIAKDVDGPNSLPLHLDTQLTNLGKIHATRRVARAIYLGSAPTVAAAHRGLEDRRIRLGCLMPGESAGVFDDAVRRLAAAATYLYQDGPRYWYSTQPTVTKLAEDRAEQLKRDTDKIVQELDARLRADLKNCGGFARVHPLPPSSQDVPDDLDARLVVLGTDHPYTREPDSAAVVAAKAILESRGNQPRMFRNTLVFLAGDKTRLQDLDDATRRYVAWKSILAEKDTLDLSPHQVRQAETQLNGADGTVAARLPETYQWLLVPEQKTPQEQVTWEVLRLSANEPLAVRAGKRLRKEELLLTALGPTILRKYLDDFLWRGEDHVEIRQLADDFARYLYLPRLADPSVLVESIREGLGLLTWEQDSFAFADSFDEEEQRYKGLRSGQLGGAFDSNSSALLVHPAVAAKQLREERPPEGAQGGDGDNGDDGRDNGEPGDGRTEAGGDDDGREVKRVLRRFHGSVALDPQRAGRDASRVAEEVIGHLTGIVSAKVKITMEIEANVPNGVPENVVRIVTENARTLKFESQGFEEE